MRIAWTPEALRELEQIESYIARDSPRAAKDLTLRLVERVQLLAAAPYGAPRLPRYQRDDLRMLFERPYRIVLLDSAGTGRDRDVVALSPTRRATAGAVKHVWAALYIRSAQFAPDGEPTGSIARYPTRAGCA